MDDLEFLIEMRNRLKKGLEKNDPEELKYVAKMIDDWIDEIVSA